jgi:hypothetical protein
MGTEYQHWLIPSPNSFAPRSENVVALINALADTGWIEGVGRLQHTVGRGTVVEVPKPLTSGWLEPHTESDYLITWQMVDPSIADAFARPQPTEEGHTYFLRIESAGKDGDYIYRSSDTVDEFENVECDCGEELPFEVDLRAKALYEMRIHLACPQCKKTVNVSSWPAASVDRSRRFKDVVPGGITSLFGIAIHCGRDLPTAPDSHEATKPLLSPAFIALCSTLLDCRLHEVNDDNC